MFDNREAMAYMIFRRFRCSRVEALAAIDELVAYFRPIAKLSKKRWRSRKNHGHSVDRMLGAGK